VRELVVEPARQDEAKAGQTAQCFIGAGQKLFFFEISV
jgi:hypothetical protein